MSKKVIQNGASTEELRAMGTSVNKYNREKAMLLISQLREKEKEKLKNGYKWIKIMKGYALVKLVKNDI